MTAADPGLARNRQQVIDLLSQHKLKLRLEHIPNSKCYLRD